MIGTASATVEYTGGVMHFWNESNIPSLYGNVSNATRMSYNATTDVYTMHLPFYQNKSGDSFNFNESVHLESNNDGSPSYFQWVGNVEFDNHKIVGWNTNTNTTAPRTDSTRAYLYTDSGSGNITNGNMSYLGYNSPSKYGIVLNYFTGSNVANNTMIDNYHGTTLGGTDNVDVNNNTISGAYIGIFASACDHNTFDNNEVFNNDIGGINLAFSSVYNNFTNNIVYNNSNVGIAITTASSNTVLSGNYLYDNTAEGLKINANDCTVSNNHIYSNGADGLELNSDNAIVSGNTVYSNDFYGIEILSCTGVSLNNNLVNNDLDSYYDYNIGSSSTGTIVTDTTKNSDTYRIDTTSDPLIFQNGVDYNITVTETTVIRDNFPTGTKAALITVLSGTIDQIDITSLSPNLDYHLKNFASGVVIESQKSDASGDATFTSNLSAASYVITDNLNNFTYSNGSITPETVNAGKPFTVSININDPDGTIIIARVTINDGVYEMTNDVGDTWSYTFTDTSVPTRYSVHQFTARDNDDEWNTTTSNLYIDVQSSSGGGDGGELTPTDPPFLPPSGGVTKDHKIEIGKTHITIPEFFESPLLEIAIFMIISLMVVGVYIEVRR